MRRILLVLIALFLLPATAHAATVTVPIAGDTFVRSDLPNDSFNSTNPLQLDGNPIRRPLLWFKDVPTGTSATLRLHSEWHTSEPFEVHLSSCNWSGSVTYNTAPPVGALLATVPDDPVGWIDIPVPASQLTAETCLAVTKTGDNWTDISSKDSSFGAQLVVETGTPPPPPPPPPPDTSPVAKCGGTPVSATPSTLSSIVASRDDVVINASPGTYSNLNMYPSSAKTCVEIHCTVSAKSGDFGRNPNGCNVTGQSNIGAIRNLTIEGFEFTTSDDYGLAIYDESPNVGMKVRLADNVFNGNMLHDISTKVRVAYTEVVGNYFISCGRHCWEIGQNENLTSRPSTTGTAVFRDNKVSSRIMGLTQNSNVNLTVTGNEFRSVNYAIENRPLWYATNNNLVPAVFQTGSLTVLNYYPALRTTITGNTFTGSNVMHFSGRGTTDDVILIKGNTGTASCSRVGMASDEAATYYNEQTTAAPKLDPASDMPC